MGGQVLPPVTALTVTPAGDVVNNLIAEVAAAIRYGAGSAARAQGFAQVALNFILRAVNVIAHVFIQSGLLGTGAQPTKKSSLPVNCP